MRSNLTLYFLFALCIGLNAQEVQQLRGIVRDSETKVPMIGVVIVIDIRESDPIGSISDNNGRYKLSNIPLGRHQVRYNYLGYKEVVIGDVIFNSAKEVLIDVELEESTLALKELVVVAGHQSELINEMAIVGGRSFSVDETNRYAGSRGDPSRMVTNYAGVQGADDSRNDIVIRGNTPQGLLWRLEGVNIPNPNHFAIPGTAGGPVTILNNKFLSNSDFFTGAFPADYANGISGAFDLKMRNGNSEEKRIQRTDRISWNGSHG